MPKILSCLISTVLVASQIPVQGAQATSDFLSQAIVAPTVASDSPRWLEHAPRTQVNPSGLLGIGLTDKASATGLPSRFEAFLSAPAHESSDWDPLAYALDTLGELLLTPARVPLRVVQMLIRQGTGLSWERVYKRHAKPDAVGRPQGFVIFKAQKERYFGPRHESELRRFHEFVVEGMLSEYFQIVATHALSPDVMTRAYKAATLACIVSHSIWNQRNYLTGLLGHDIAEAKIVVPIEVIEWARKRGGESAKPIDAKGFTALVYTWARDKHETSILAAFNREGNLLPEWKLYMNNDPKIGIVSAKELQALTLLKIPSLSNHPNVQNVLTAKEPKSQKLNENPLSSLEQIVFDLYVKGWSIEFIAEYLNKEAKTVYANFQHVKDKKFVYASSAGKQSQWENLWHYYVDEHGPVPMQLRKELQGWEEGLPKSTRLFFSAVRVSPATIPVLLERAELRYPKALVKMENALNRSLHSHERVSHVAIQNGFFMDWKIAATLLTAGVSADFEPFIDARSRAIQRLMIAREIDLLRSHIPNFKIDPAQPPAPIHPFFRPTSA